MKKQSTFSQVLKGKEIAKKKADRDQKRKEAKELKERRSKQLSQFNRIKTLLETMELALSECETDILPFLIKRKRWNQKVASFFGSEDEKDGINVVNLGHEELVVESSGKDMMDEWVTDRTLFHRCDLFLILRHENFVEKEDRAGFLCFSHWHTHTYLLTVDVIKKLIAKMEKDKSDHLFYLHYQENESLQKLVNFFEKVAQSSEEFQKFLANKLTSAA